MSISQIPASVLAQWIEIVETEKTVQVRGWGLIINCAVMGALATLVVGLRMWLRVVVQRKADVSDWFTLIALITTLAFSVLACVSDKVYGMDHHLYNLTLRQDVTLLKIDLAATILNHWSGGLVRISVLLFYRRLIKYHPSVIFDRVVIGAIAFITLDMIGPFFAMFAACRPLNAFWDSGNPAWAATHEFSCDNHAAFLLAVDGINIVSDVFISLMPVGILWGMQLPRKQKVAIWALFGLGLTATAAAAAKMYACVYAFYDTYDYSWAIYNMYFFAALEGPLALIFASAPTLKSLFRNFFSDRPSPAPDCKQATDSSTTTVATDMTLVASRYAPSQLGGKSALALDMDADLDLLECDVEGGADVKSKDADVGVLSSVKAPVWSVEYEEEMDRMLEMGRRL